MAPTNRAAILLKLHKVLKKHYKPVEPVRQRTVMENLLYACCLEDAKYEAADECFARLQESYFDWNEVRVTTIRELGEVFRGIPNATANASNLKHVLQSVFESQYSFDLDHLRKLNLGKAMAMLEKYRGVTQFSLAYVTQASLGGHSIPLGKGGMDIMSILCAVNDKEAATGNVPGLERAIPKNKGVEFGSLLHQLAADLIASPFATRVRGILLEVDADCKSRLPKRIDKKKVQAERKRIEAEAIRKRKEDDAKKQADILAAAAKLAEEKQKQANRKSRAAAKASAKKTPAAKAPVKKKSKSVAKKSVSKGGIAASGGTKKPQAAKLSKKAAKKPGKKSASKQLARRKPR